MKVITIIIYHPPVGLLPKPNPEMIVSSYATDGVLQKKQLNDPIVNEIFRDPKKYSNI
jgi:hypothetical protein